LQQWVSDLNRFYRATPSLFEKDFDPSGFDWIDCGDNEQSVISLVRRGDSSNDLTLIICNFTPVPRHNYRIGVPRKGFWREALNSDAHEYAGSGQGNLGEVEARPIPFHGKSYSLNLTLPPLSVLFLENKEA
jgi:1,4-alpha-glucan branching enzyme